jgi:hypothetical protein
MTRSASAIDAHFGARLLVHGVNVLVQRDRAGARVLGARKGFVGLLDPLHGDYVFECARAQPAAAANLDEFLALEVLHHQLDDIGKG